ncbi:MAG: hypothetical protein CL726_04285 [Chloroflexi bacterium]|nr:hypothetical protein [Chloroflexota bacterium]
MVGVGGYNPACELWVMLSVVRVNKLDETLILRTLDQGASAVLIPFVITVPKSNWKSAPANTHRTESRE